MACYGIFKTHAGMAYGKPIICYIATNKWQALSFFRKEHSISSDISDKYAAIPV